MKPETPNMVSKKIDKQIYSGFITEMYRQLRELGREIEGWDIKGVELDGGPTVIGLTNMEQGNAASPAIFVGVSPSPEFKFYIAPYTLYPEATEIAVWDTVDGGTLMEVTHECELGRDPETLLEAHNSPATTPKGAIKRVQHYCEMLG